MTAAKKTILFLGSVEKILPATCMGLLAIFITAITVMRYVFNYSILGFEEFTVIIAVYLYFVGSGLATRMNKQVRVNFIDSFHITKRTRKVIDLIVSLLAFFICLAFSYFTFNYSLWTLKRHITIDPLGWPMAIMGFGPAIGLLLMGIHELNKFLKNLRPAAENTREG